MHLRRFKSSLKFTHGFEWLVQKNNRITLVVKTGHQSLSHFKQLDRLEPYGLSSALLFVLKK